MDFKEFNGAELTAFLIAGKIAGNNPGITGEYVDGFFDWIDKPSNRVWIREEIVDWPIVEEPVEPPPSEVCESDFNLVMEMTNQLNDECGFWFTEAWLEVKYNDGKIWQSSRSGEIFIKKSSGKVGKFKADLSSIPCDATIREAILYMVLERDEGLAWGDK